MINKGILLTAALSCLAVFLPGVSLSQPIMMAKAERVINGNTIVLANGDIVKYIGVEVDEETDVGRAASNMNAELLAGADVRLEFDSVMRDRQGRLLAYVYVGDLMVNEVLLKMGLAKVEAYSSNTRYLTRFLRLQTEASKLGRGMWAGGSSAASPDAGAASAPTMGSRQPVSPEPGVIVEPPAGGGALELTPEEIPSASGQGGDGGYDGGEIVGGEQGPVIIEGR